MDLDDDEKAALEAFLETLTDFAFLQVLSLSDHFSDSQTQMKITPTIRFCLNE